MSGITYRPPQLVAQDGKVYVLYADCTAYQPWPADYPINLVLATWDGSSWNAENLYHFSGTCEWNLNYQLVGDGGGRLAIVANIQSDSVRPSPLLVIIWKEGTETQSLTTFGTASPQSSSPLFRFEPKGPASLAGGMPETPHYVIRDGGWESITTEDSKKTATYGTGSYSSQPIPVGAVADSSTYINGLSRHGYTAAADEYSYDQNRLDVERGRPGQASPILNVSLLGSAFPHCTPPATGAEEVSITAINLSVDDLADWQVNNIGLQASGTGNDQADVQKVILATKSLAEVV